MLHMYVHKQKFVFSFVPGNLEMAIRAEFSSNPVVNFQN